MKFFKKLFDYFINFFRTWPVADLPNKNNSRQIDLFSDEEEESF